MKFSILTITFCISILLVKHAIGQLSLGNSISQYYTNDYIRNPAYAGKNTQTQLYSFLHTAWTGFDNPPRLIGFAADTHFGQNSGAGMQLISNRNGVLEQYAGKLSYSYRIKLDDKENQLRIGTSLTLYREQVSFESVIPNVQPDPVAKNFNNRGINYDGDLGVAFDNKNFSISIVKYNLSAMVHILKDYPAGLPHAQIQASYTCKINDKLQLTPLLSYSILEKQADLITMAGKLAYDELFNAALYWQSPGNVMGSIGIKLFHAGEINIFYLTNPKYTFMQQYEVGFKLSI